MAGPGYTEAENGLVRGHTAWHRRACGSTGGLGPQPLVIHRSDVRSRRRGWCFWSVRDFMSGRSRESIYLWLGIRTSVNAIVGRLRRRQDMCAFGRKNSWSANRPVHRERLEI